MHKPKSTVLRARALLFPALLLLGLHAAGPAAAQTYPDRPIKMISTIPAGSASDTMLRHLAERMGESLKQPVVVENRMGAGGIIGTRALVTAPNDGYTIGITSNGALPAAPYLYKNVGYDVLKGFSHIGMFAYLPYVLVVQKDVPGENLAQFISHVRANPGKLSSGYYANSLRMALHELEGGAKLKFQKIPYKASGQLLTDMGQGLVHFAVVPLSVANLAQQNGFARIVAVTTNRRWELLPNVPAVSEVIPGYQNVAWAALSAPSGTPPDIVAKLRAALNDVLARPETRKRWSELGADLVTGDGQAVQSHVVRDMPLWESFTKEANIAPE